MPTGSKFPRMPLSGFISEPLGCVPAVVVPAGGRPPPLRRNPVASS
jgi:hypothetical protein